MTVVVNALTAIRTAAIARVMSHIVSKVSHHNPIFSKFSTSLLPVSRVLLKAIPIHISSPIV